MEGRILVCGNMVHDILVRPVREPLGWGASTVVEAIEHHIGGNGGSTSYTLGKLGIPVTLKTLVGDDETARQLLRQLESVGVDVSAAHVSPSATPAVVALVGPSGRRALLYQLGASREPFPRPFQFPEDTSHLHINAIFRIEDLRSSAPEFLKMAKEAGLSTSIDTQWDHEEEWMPVLSGALPYTDLLFVNEDEGRYLTGLRDPAAIALALRDAGAGEVIVKLGERGCFGSTAEGDFFSNAVEASAIDTTGAGDVFVGAYLAALYRERPHRQAADFANMVASLSVQHLGAITGLGGLNPGMLS